MDTVNKMDIQDRSSSLAARLNACTSVLDYLRELTEKPDGSIDMSLHDELICMICENINSVSDKLHTITIDCQN